MSFKCGICGKEYDTVAERAACEASCMKAAKVNSAAYMEEFNDIREKFNAFTDALVSFIHKNHFDHAFLSNTEDGFRFCISRGSDNLGLRHEVEYTSHDDELLSTDDYQVARGVDVIRAAQLENINTALDVYDMFRHLDINEDELFDDSDDSDNSDCCSCCDSTCDCNAKSEASAAKTADSPAEPAPKCADSGTTEESKPTFTAEVYRDVNNRLDPESVIFTVRSDDPDSDISVRFSSEIASKMPFGDVMTCLSEIIAGFDKNKSGNK